MEATEIEERVGSGGIKARGQEDMEEEDAHTRAGEVLQRTENI